MKVISGQVLSGQDFGSAATPEGVAWYAGEALDGGDGSDHVTGWIYDHLRPHAAAVEVAHPLMLRAIAAAMKKSDRIVICPESAARA